jgi:acyl-CoA synthetase (NDP forming)/RimJ/RimL family protein N-acetyltransferase
VSDLKITSDDVDTLASDGRIVHIRDIRPDDLDELVALNDRASDRSIYFRYFSPNREAAERYVTKVSESVEAERRALGAFEQGRLLGLGVIERIGRVTAEFALLVADECHNCGIGTLLLEHLIAEARGAGIERFVADVLATNAQMIQVMRDLGFAPVTQIEHGEMHLEFALELNNRVVSAIGERERRANVVSLRPLLAPRSIAVIGAGQHPGTAGHEVLRNLLAADFTRDIHVVNPNRDTVLGLPCLPSPADLPDDVDLAVIALPADQVADVLAACGKRGVRAAVLFGSGFSETGADGAELQDAALDTAREYGIRLLGPNCIGVVNTDPDVRLDATFATLPHLPGSLAVLAQSGAFGVALIAAAASAGQGISQMVSVGNKADVGGNDLLLAWEADERTRVIGMYLESIGDPRRFARIARRVASVKPLLAVKSGRTEVGQRAGRSHTAAAASSDVAIDALFRSSGVLRVHTMQEMLDAARVLSGQPLPAGPRVAIVGNSGGPEILAADAATEAGLDVVEFDDATRAALAALGAPGQNPLDLGAAATAQTVGPVLRAVLDSPSVDAVLTVFTRIAIADADEIAAVVAEAAHASGKTVVAVTVGDPPSTLSRSDDAEWALPVFTFPEPAAAALGLAHRYAELRTSPIAMAQRPAGVDPGTAREIVETALAAGRDWLTADESHRLLRAYGLPVPDQAVVDDVDAAVTAAGELGYPLVAKLATPGLHKSDVGGVRVGIADAGALRAAIADFDALGGAPGQQVLLQPMIGAGTELIVGAVHDAHCGPLVMIGAGGVLTDVLGDRSFGLAPLTAHDAEQVLGRLRSARLLDGFRGAPVVSRAAVTDVLIRVAALVDDVPQIAELDLNPLICRTDGLSAVDARIRVAVAPRHPDPLVRQLRGHALP